MITATLAMMASIAPAWAVGPNLQYQWGGNDYLPVGIQCDFGSTLLEPAKAAGISDFNIETPLTTPWGKIAEALQGKRFFITLNSAMPSARGFTVQPQSYRIANIQNPTSIAVRLPGATKAFVVVALRRDMTPISEKLYPVENGVLKAQLKAARDSDQVVLVYPQGESMEMEDLWERLDERRDFVLKQIRSMGPQAGLRGIINPLGTTPHLASQDQGFVPTTAMFHREFADFLEQKYRNSATLVKAWQIKGFDSTFKPPTENQAFQDTNEFSALARLVPLWNGAKGVPLLLDPVAESTYPSDLKKCSYWRDLAECISQTRARRIHRLVRALRKEANAPILQEWNGWSWFFESPNSEFSGFTAKLSKLTPSSILSSLASPLSSSLRTRNSIPLVATDVPVTTESMQQSVIDQLSDLGVRGLFYRATNEAQLKQIKAASALTAVSKPEGVFYPQNATNPASAHRMGGSVWHLPSPNDGNRIDLGPTVSCYSVVRGGVVSYVLWTDLAPQKIEFRSTEFKGSLIRGIQSAIPPAVATKTGFSMMVDSNPILVSGVTVPPVPEAEILRLEREILQVVSWAKSVRKDVSNEAFEFRTFPEALKSNPFLALLIAQRTHRKLSVVAAGANWNEWESATDNTFSEVIKDAGCSNGSYLSLQTPLGEMTGPLYAVINVPQRTSATLDVWIAARIPNSIDRDRLKIRVGGQILSIRGEPVSIYGSGFGWYNLGSTRLPSLRTEVRADILGVVSTDIGLDAICLTPQPFQPNQVNFPAWTLPAAPTTDPKKG